MIMGTVTAIRNQTATVLALTPSNTPTLTPSPTITLTPTPSSTPNPTSLAQKATSAAKNATLESFNDPCSEDGDVTERGGAISPDGKWFAFPCTEGDNTESSYILVYNPERDIRWQIYYKDYHRHPEYAYQDRNDIGLFHWSNDGRYLYAISSSIGSGCCWIGWITLLVRLNLNTGEQVAIFNYTDNIFQMTDISISPSTRYLLYYSSDNLIIKDLLTWENRTIKLISSASAGYAIMSNNEDKILLMLREYPDESRGDFTYGSYLFIDLVSGKQTKFFTGIDFNEAPEPIRWENEEEVLLADYHGQYWLLDIQTGELVQVENP